MNNLSELHQKSQELDVDKADHIVMPSTAVFTQNHELKFNDVFGLSSTYKLSEWAIKQACDKMGGTEGQVALYNYQKVVRGDGEHWADTMNYWRVDTGGGWLVRTHGDGARAILSQDYTPIQNTDVIETTAEMLDQTAYQLVQPHIDADNVDFKLRVTENEDGSFGQGVFIGNGETGQRGLSIKPFIQRTSCTNSIVYSAGGVFLRHFKLVKADLIYTIKRHMGEALKITGEMMNRILMAEVEQIPDFSEYVSAFCKKNNVSQVGYGIIMVGAEGQQTTMGLVNGLSFYAHHQENHDTELRLENLAAAVLMDDFKGEIEL